MANVELAKKILDAITAKPELWDQAKWAVVDPEWGPDEVPEDIPQDAFVEGTCGTQMCIAGWACHLSGRKIDWSEGEFLGYEDPRFVSSELVGGGSVEGTAQELLGLSEFQTSRLFYSLDNDIAKKLLTQVVEHGELIDPWLEDGD